MAKPNSEITQEQLKSILSYDPETGIFRWIRMIQGFMQPGPIAGFVNSGEKKYIRIRMATGETYSIHRLAWLYVYGVWPENQVDHINGNKQDNRISNLREATNGQNKCNGPVRKDSVSGHRGIYQDKRTGRWRAHISINNKRIWIGFFSTIEKAIAARKRYEIAMHGEFAWGALSEDVREGQ